MDANAKSCIKYDHFLQIHCHFYCMSLIPFFFFFSFIEHFWKFGWLFWARGQHTVGKIQVGPGFVSDSLEHPRSRVVAYPLWLLSEDSGPVE